jgi:hypothetical protein
MDSLSFTDFVISILVNISINSGGEICKAMNATFQLKNIEKKNRSSPRLRRKVD